MTASNITGIGLHYSIYVLGSLTPIFFLLLYCHQSVRYYFIANQYFSSKLCGNINGRYNNSSYVEHCPIVKEMRLYSIARIKIAR